MGSPDLIELTILILRITPHYEREIDSMLIGFRIGGVFEVTVCVVIVVDVRITSGIEHKRGPFANISRTVCGLNVP